MRKFLYSINDPQEYLKVLEYLRPNRPNSLTIDDAKELLSIYNKYNEDKADLEFIQTWLTIDATVGKEELRVEDYTPIGLNEDTISAIFETLALVKTGADMDPENIDNVLKYARNPNVYEGVRVALARLAMDILMRSSKFFDYVTEVSKFTDIMTEFGPDAIDHYATLIREVQLVCMNV